MIIEMGFTIKGVARKIGLNRMTVSKWFNVPNLEFHKMKQVGDVIGYDFGQDYPDWPYAYRNPEQEVGFVSEDPATYHTLAECQKNYRILQGKYTDLLEKYAHMFERFKLNPGGTS